MNRHVLPISVAVLAVAASGCGSDEDPKETAGAPTTAAAEAPPLGPQDIPKQTSKPQGPYNGRYEGVLTRAQAVQFGDPKFAGKVTLTLKPDGSYVYTNNQGTAKGQYGAAAGNRWVFAKDDTCEPDQKGKGLYGWKLSGTTLRITAVVAETGGCTGRSQGLTLPTWRKTS